MSLPANSSHVLGRTLSERENEEGGLSISLKGLNLCALTPQEAKDCICSGIPNREPDRLSHHAGQACERGHSRDTPL